MQIVSSERSRVYRLVSLYAVVFIFGIPVASASSERLSDAVGVYLTQSAEAALPEFRALAADGNALAHTFIGIIYATGQGSARDLQMALHWWRRAGELGSRDAVAEIVDLYREGNRQLMTQQETRFWLSRGAEIGITEAFSAMAEFIMEGKSSQSDFAEAAVWYRAGSEHYDAASMFALGVFYAMGVGVDRDEIQALAWFDLARRTGLDLSYTNAFVAERERLMPQQAAKAEEIADRWVRHHEWSAQNLAQSSAGLPRK